METPAFLLSNAQRLINGLLTLDPETAQKLGEMEGRCLQFHVNTPDLNIYCLPLEGQLQLQNEWQLEPDCIIRGSAAGLLNMVRSDNPTEAISRGEVEITGDSRLAQQFSDILGELDLDWEEFISGFIGDFAAHRLGNTVRSFSSWIQDSNEAMRLNTTEYLQEEVRAVPTPHEIARFMDEVDDFRSAIDRFEARLKHLERKGS